MRAKTPCLNFIQRFVLPVDGADRLEQLITLFRGALDP